MRQFLVQWKLLGGSDSQKCVFENLIPNKGHPNDHAKSSSPADFVTMWRKWKKGGAVSHMINNENEQQLSLHQEKVSANSMLILTHSCKFFMLTGVDSRGQHLFSSYKFLHYLSVDLTVTGTALKRRFGV